MKQEKYQGPTYAVCGQCGKALESDLALGYVGCTKLFCSSNCINTFMEKTDKEKNNGN